MYRVKKYKTEWRNADMGNFMEDLQKEMARVNQDNNNNEEVDSPYKHLKHDSLVFSKDTPSHIVRILPPVNGGFFAKEFKEIFVKATNKNGKEIKVMATVGANQTPDDSMFVRSVLDWQQKGLIPDNFGGQAKFSKRYYVNAVSVQADQNGNAVMETDNTGQLVVRLLKLPATAYQQILSKLADPMLQPQGEQEYGFIGIQNAFPVKITKPAPGSMSYGVDVYSNRELGALPQGWEQLVEDLEYQATPTEEYDHTYLPLVMDILNGNEDNRTNQGGGQQQQNQGFAQAPQQNQFQNSTTQQNQFQNTQQQNQGFGQAPQQNQGSGQAPQQQQNQGFGQAPQQQNQGFGQAPQQPQQNQAPQQTFNQAPQQQTQQNQAPQQQNQGFEQAPQQPQQAQAPQQTQQNQAPQQQQQNNNTSGTQSIDDVLGKLKQGFNS